MIPKDPVMLLSFINLKLRDEYADMDALCDALDVDKAEIEAILKSAGFIYNQATNQYR